MTASRVAAFVAGAIATAIPTGSWNQIRRTADSTSAEAAKQPPPAWLSRIAPAASGYRMAGSDVALEPGAA